MSSDQSVTIRPATADEDFDAIAQLYLTVWRSAYAGMIPAATLAALTPKLWRPAERWQLTHLAVTATDQVVGVIAAGPARRSQWAGQTEIYSLYVLPGFQHQQIGSRLMQAALADLSSADVVNLLVLAKNQAARRFYDCIGFHDTGQHLVDTMPDGTKLINQIYRL